MRKRYRSQSEELTSMKVKPIGVFRLRARRRHSLGKSSSQRIQRVVHTMPTSGKTIHRACNQVFYLDEGRGFVWAQQYSMFNRGVMMEISNRESARYQNVKGRDQKRELKRNPIGRSRAGRVVDSFARDEITIFLLEGFVGELFACRAVQRLKGRTKNSVNNRKINRAS